MASPYPPPPMCTRSVCCYTCCWPVGRPHLYTEKSPAAFAAVIEATRPAALRVAAREQPPAGVSVQRLRGDIERLAQKALAADPRERYASVAEFDADVARLLAGRPITAHPRSLPYRFGKLLLRNRVASAAVVLAAVGLMAATAFSVRQAQLAERERQRAERRFNDVRRIANVVLFDLNDSLANISGTLAVRELLVQNALRYLDELARETGREPELLTELATAYERIAEVQGMPSWPGHGRSGNALASLERALDLHRRANEVAGASALAEARVLSNLGSILAARGESSAARDRQLQSEAALITLAPEERDVDWVLQLARIQVATGDAIWELGDVPGAGRQYERALLTVKEGAGEIPGIDHAHAPGRGGRAAPGRRRRGSRRLAAGSACITVRRWRPTTRCSNENPAASSCSVTWARISRALAPWHSC